MKDAWFSGGRGVSIRLTRWMPHVPHPRQQAFLWINDREVLYGGAAGGGKSEALLLGALQYVDVPGYAALLLRRTYPELSQPNGLMDMAHQWLHRTDARWNESKRQWRFPSGATLSFGYLQHETDKYRYQGAQFQYVGFDELTQFRPSDYTYLFSRLRRLKGSNVPIRMRAASNPGGAGHRWVKARFPIDSPIEYKNGRPRRMFIPAKLSDNPSLDAEEYIQALEELDEREMQQLLDGDWNVRPPGNWMLDHRYIEAMVEKGRELREQFEVALRDPDSDDALPPPWPSSPKLRENLHFAVDWGEVTQGYIVWPLESGGFYIVPSEVVMRHREPGESTEAMLDVAVDMPYPVDSVAYDAAGAQSQRTFNRTAREYEEFEKMGSCKVSFGKYKRETIGYIRRLGKRTLQGKTTRIGAIDPENEELIAQLYGWERKDEQTDEAVKDDDHGPDAVVAGVAPIATANRVAVEKSSQRKREREEARA